MFEGVKQLNNAHKQMTSYDSASVKIFVLYLLFSL